MGVLQSTEFENYLEIWKTEELDEFVQKMQMELSADQLKTLRLNVHIDEVYLRKCCENKKLNYDELSSEGSLMKSLEITYREIQFCISDAYMKEYTTRIGRAIERLREQVVE